MTRHLARAWRALTSMRTALVLLFLLALAAVPGSLLPQRPVNRALVFQYKLRHPYWGSVIDRLGGFDVFGAPWFLGLYALLAVSLVGCLWPRFRLHFRAMTARPPAPPKVLDRLPFSAEGRGAGSPEEVVDAAETLLRRKRWRVERRTHDDGAVSVAAEKGHLRETGNLAFHSSILLILVGIATGALFGYQGTLLVVEGETFTNTGLAYDELRLGRLVSGRDLPPFSLRLDDFRATYLPSGQPSSFEARVHWAPGLDAAARPQTLRVNQPLTVRGSRVYLLDHGFAPRLVVRDRSGRVVYDQATPFLPEETATYVSRGVIKVPDAGPVQLGFQAYFYPTLGVDADGRTYSRFPDDQLPAVTYTAYAGDLGLSSGVPQSVYALDTSRMVETGTGFLLDGQTETGLAGGASISFEGHREYAVFQVTDDPGKWLVLGSGVLALLGITLSLRVRRRRIWVRAAAGPDGTVVQVGGLARQDPEGFRAEFSGLANELTTKSAVAGERR